MRMARQIWIPLLAAIAGGGAIVYALVVPVAVTIRDSALPKSGPIEVARLPEISELEIHWGNRLFTSPPEPPPKAVVAREDGPSKIEPPPPPKPPLELKSIFYSERSKIAVFGKEGVSAAIRLREGQEAEGVEVLTIREDGVEIRFAGRQSVLPLTRPAPASSGK